MGVGVLRHHVVADVLPPVELVGVLARQQVRPGVGHDLEITEAVAQESAKQSRSESRTPAGRGRPTVRLVAFPSFKRNRVNFLKVIVSCDQSQLML